MMENSKKICAECNESNSEREATERLFDKDGISISLFEVEKTLAFVVLRLIIVNNSANEFLIQVRGESVNGFKVGSCTDTFKFTQGKAEVLNVDFMSTTFMDMIGVSSIDDIENIELSFLIFGRNLTAFLHRTKVVRISDIATLTEHFNEDNIEIIEATGSRRDNNETLETEKLMNNEKEATEILFEKEGISISLIEIEKTSAFVVVRLLIVNNSANEIMVTVTGKSVNGFMGTYSAGVIDVMQGRKAVLNMDFMSTTLMEIGISSIDDIENIELSVLILSQNPATILHKSFTVSIKPKRSNINMLNENKPVNRKTKDVLHKTDVVKTKPKHSNMDVLKKSKSVFECEICGYTDDNEFGNGYCEICGSTNGKMFVCDFCGATSDSGVEISNGVCLLCADMLDE